MDPTREEILAGYSRAGQSLSFWRQSATPNELRRKSNGTRWTNEELLFHMVFGYMVVRALIPLVHVVSRLPEPVGGGFAALLNAGTPRSMPSITGAPAPRRSSTTGAGRARS